MKLAVHHPLRNTPAVSGPVLAVAMIGLAVGAAVWAGWAPLLFSIVTVFLFAGPHNWLEARYFLTRLPARWGKLTGFFVVGFGGVVVLTAAFALIPWLSTRLPVSAWHGLIASWNTAVIVWIAALAHMRARQNPRRDWGWTVPVAFLLIAGNWFAPFIFSLFLVYVHPLMALWLFDRELKRTKPQWRPAYHACLAVIPVLLAALWWKLWNAPPLPGDTELFTAIADHAGAGWITNVSSHLLVATHTFLEMVHYSVWILAMPLVGIRLFPWRLDNVPIARRGGTYRWGVAGVLIIGATIMLALWAGFLADYPTTRHVYFTIALMHVLAEVPFLLRAL